MECRKVAKRMKQSDIIVNQFRGDAIGEEEREEKKIKKVS